MIKNTVFALFLAFFTHFQAKAQLSVPLSSLPAKAELRVKNSTHTEGVLYASVYSDTLKRCRLWLFYDTSKPKLTLRSVLFEQFSLLNFKERAFSPNESPKSRSGRYHFPTIPLLEKQLYVSVDVLEKNNWEDRDFLMGGCGATDRAFISFFKKVIRQNFPHQLSTMSTLLKEEPVGTIRHFKIRAIGGYVEAALQLPPKQIQINHYIDWLDILFEYKGKDSLGIYQWYKISYETQQLRRQVKNNRLISMYFVDFGIDTFDREFNYDENGKLNQILDGHKNIDGVMEDATIITVVEIKN